MADVEAELLANAAEGGGDSQCLIINLKHFTHLFLVMELGELDFKKLFDTVPKTELEKIIL